MGGLSAEKTTETQTEPAKKVGRYQLVERVAIGGMAEVFLAAERGSALSLDRLVVIKRILPHLAADQRFVRMFFREARVAARITHPNVVQIYELGESDGLPFIAMEYVAGSTLKDLLFAARSAQVQLPVDIVLHILIQALSGVHAAHELADSKGRPAGLVHRDLSPHNLMVTTEAHVKLLDFGIAKATQDLSEDTKTGVLKGKVSYMSPEQARQEDLDRRSDVFAMGIVGWELFAGEKLFDAGSELAIMQAIVHGETKDLQQQRPDVPKPVVNVLERALSTDRGSRWRSAAQMRKALLRAAQVSGIDIDTDRAALFVKTLLGASHAERARAVNTALERTLVTLSTRRLPTEEATTLTHTTITETVANTAGVVGAVGLAGMLGLASTALFVAALLAIFRAGPFAGLGDPSEAPLVHRFAGEPVRFSFAAPTGEGLLRAEYEPLRTYLEDKLERPVLFSFFEDYETVKRQLITGEVEFASLPPNTFLHAQAEEPEIALVAIKQFDGSNGTDGYLVVAEGSPVSQVAELKGRTLCHPNQLSTTGYALCHAYIEQQGLDPVSDMRHHFSGNHHQVLRDVISGACTAGCTFSGGFLTADIAGINVSKLRILSVTGRTPHDAIVAGRATPDALTTSVRSSLLSFDPKTVLNRDRMGDTERVTGFVEASEEDYATLRAILAIPAP